MAKPKNDSSIRNALLRNTGNIKAGSTTQGPKPRLSPEESRREAIKARQGK